MFIMSAITVLSAGAVAFYIRFLVALCRECRPHWVAYWVRLQRHAQHDSVVESLGDEYPISRAA
ncbi:MAG TPA: hypothetical protein VH437_20875 [Terriglobales bacterium]|jgi:hypothetical protein